MDVLYGRIVVHLGGGGMCWGVYSAEDAEVERLHGRGGIMMLLVVVEVVVGRAPPENVVSGLEGANFTDDAQDRIRTWRRLGLEGIYSDCNRSRPHAR
jgi:hypothetical protein